MAFYDVVHIEGHVYSIVKQDTLYLENVEVILIIEDPTLTTLKGGINYDARYITATNSNGYFKMNIDFVPYEANYTLRFRKAKYNRRIIMQTLRFSNHSNLNVQLNKSYKKHTFVEIEGGFTELQYTWSYRYSKLISVLLLLFVIAIPLTWKYFPFMWFIDQYRKMTRMGFLKLSKTKQDAFLKDGFCDVCKDYKGMSFEREESVTGMVFIHGTCDSCRAPIKVRIK